jgi:hypothetical protein
MRSVLESASNTRQLVALDALATFAFDPQTSSAIHGSPTGEQNTRLDELLFNILEASFFLDFIPSELPICPTDLTIMLLWITADGAFVKPSTASSYCAKFQYWAYTTVAHRLRLLVKNDHEYHHAAGGNQYNNCVQTFRS